MYQHPPENIGISPHRVKENRGTIFSISIYVVYNIYIYILFYDKRLLEPLKFIAVIVFQDLIFKILSRHSISGIQCLRVQDQV